MARSVPKLKPLDMEIDNFIERNSNKLIKIARYTGLVRKDAFQQTHVLLREKPELLKQDDKKTLSEIFSALWKYASPCDDAMNRVDKWKYVFPDDDDMNRVENMEVTTSEQVNSDLVCVSVTTTMKQYPTRTSLLKIIDIITNATDKRKDGKGTMRLVLTEHFLNGVDKYRDIAKRLKIAERTVSRNIKQAHEVARLVRNKIEKILFT